MKKITLLGLAAVLMLAASACGGRTVNNKAAASNAGTVAQVLEAASDQTNAPGEAAPAEEAAQGTKSEPAGVEADVDLTRLSSTMVYSEVSQMVTSPDDYVGKTVRMSGSFAVYTEADHNYYACIISDATACCANGIEFVWSGDHEYPADYPAPGTEITVTGTFDLYEEGGYIYSQLADAEVVF